MKFRALLIILLLAVISATGWLFRDQLQSQYRRNQGDVLLVQQSTTDFVEQIERQVFAPDPLKFPSSNERTFLTIAGVLEDTNAEREKNGLLKLELNTKLSAAAEVKTKDMLVKQYFAHESPEGKGPADLAKDAGYAYILVGENLALGNFGNDEKLVQAWMDSPGHRANILHERFTKIGIAVKEGMYEGHKTWMAVQEFGLPTSACLEPDTSLKSAISVKQQSLDTLGAQLTKEKKEFDHLRKSDPENYNARVETYNAKVKEYNTIAVQLKNLVEKYNAQIKILNECIQGAP